MLPLLLICLSFAACKKDENKCTAKESNVVASAAEVQRIVQYLADSSITTAVQHPSGIFYKINAPGNNIKPNICSYVTVRYVGKYFSGRIFDQTQGTSSTSFELKDLIAGWHRGLPQIGVGGSITLYIPPSLAYGPDAIYNQGVEIIPANSYMVFDIELLNIQ